MATKKTSKNRRTGMSGGRRGREATAAPQGAKQGAKQDAKRKPTKKTTAKKATTKKVVVKKKTTAKKLPSAKGSKFYLYEEGAKKFIPAEKAKPVKLDGFENFRFFLHKSADSKGWTISEVTSGGRISVGFTQKEAKEKAIEALGKHGKGDLAESIRRSISKNGAAPGFAAPKSGKLKFTVTTDDGAAVDVIYDAGMHNHFEFRGKISPTGYHSHFGYNGIRSAGGAKDASGMSPKGGDQDGRHKGAVKEAARKIANDLRVSFLKEQAGQIRKGKKGAPAKTKTQNPSGNRGRKPQGTQCLGSQDRVGTRQKSDTENPAQKRVTARRGSRPSQLDAAIEILKDAKEPLTCKEIVRRMFERKIWETNGRTPGATLSASMQREIAKRGKKSRFRRAKRGLYELNT